MNWYAVAHIDFFNHDLKIVIVEAKDEVEALINGVGEIVGVDGEWLNTLLDKSIEDIKTAFWNSDRAVDVKFIN